MDEKNIEPRQIDNGVKFQDLKKRFNGVMQKAIDSPDDELYPAFQRKIIKKTRDLQSKYPDINTYLLAYILVSGTPPDQCPNFDFPGEDSIEKFIEDLGKEEK
jgi:hypothetical protein